MTTNLNSVPEFLGLERLIALIDGVFAVAMTLLVLDLKLPSANSDVDHALRQMLPGFLIYFITFASVAGYWTIHHGTFLQIRHEDARLILLSLLNLLFVTLYPVTASIVGAHPLDPLATACLSINSLFYCISAWGVWTYASANRQILAEEADIRKLKRTAKIMLFVAIGLAIAIPLAFLSIYLVYAVWILSVPIAAGLVRERRKSGL